MKKSKYAPWLRTAAGFTITGSVIVGIANIFQENEVMIIISLASAFLGVFSGFIMLIGAEVLEYFQHITKQLYDLYNQNEPSKQHFNKTV